MSTLTGVQPLSQEQRQDARESALQALKRSIGLEPERKDYANHAVGKYPRFVTFTIMLLCIVLLLSAFTPSALRLFRIGAVEFANSVPEAGSIFAVGLTTVLTAETAQVVFSLALAVVANASSRQRKWLMFMAALATAIALVGNVTVANPHNIFTWLEALAPPIIVLGTAYVLKEQMLHAIKQRHSNEVAYKRALSKWKLSVANLTDHPGWTHYYANALREMLRRANLRLKGGKELLAALSIADWRALVYRELESENWYAAPPAPVQRLSSTSANGQLTGEVVQSMQGASEDAGSITVVCPHCEWNTTKPSEMQARLALTAHMKKHVRSASTNGHSKEKVLS